MSIAICLGIAGCGEGNQQSSPQEELAVVATTTQVADLARSVGGERVAVTGLLTPNADPHGYEIRPGDAEALSGAGLVVRSGGEIDAWLKEAIEGSGSEAPVLDLIGQVRTISGGGHGSDEEAEHADEGAHAKDGDAMDPHWWQDPRNAQRAVDAIRDAFIAADPDGRAIYNGNADSYVRDLRELDESVEKCMAQVPKDQRKLVSTHDSLGYYADRYDIEVIGTVIPSLSTQGQPSAGETRELVDTIKREKVRAIFTESSVNPKVERAIAEEAGARIGAPLWADTLGPQGSAGDTYVKSIVENTRALASGFTGGTLTCRLPS